jgi:hypothetical protein
MTIFAALYTDEDMSALVAVLLRSRGLNVTTVNLFYLCSQDRKI